MKTGGDTSERQARKRKTCAREREEGGDSQLLRAEDDFFFFLSFLGLEKEEASPTSASEKRKKESFVSLCSLERSARSSLEERSIWILLWVTSCSSRFFQELGDDI